MLITYHGHSEFYLESAGGFRLLTDPYDDHVGYKMGSYAADAVTVSHGHGDHNYTAKALDACLAIRPHVIIPMHYKTDVNASWPITDEKPFLQLLGCEKLAPMPVLRITAGDMSQQPAVALMQVKP